MGSRLLVGAIPIEPARAAARSERMSACLGRSVCTWVQAGLNGKEAYQVGGHNGVQGLGVQNHATSHGVDQHLVPLDVGEVFGDFSGDFVPEHHAVALSIALGDDREQLPGPGSGRLEGEAHDAVNSVAREDGNLCGSLPRLATVRASALACILSLAVLANDEPIQVAVVGLAKG